MKAISNLPRPKFIDCAVPGNRQCCVCPTDLPEQLQAYCGRMRECAGVNGRSAA